MHSRTHLAGPVALIAEAGSALADRVAAGLAERRFEVNRIAFNETRYGAPVAVVVLLEHHASVGALRRLLDPSPSPVLVLAATQTLIADVLPMLHAGHDLALATEAVDLTAWRLQRLIEYSRRLSQAWTQLDALTSLLNRRAFETQLRQVAESMAAGEVVGLLMIDLDRFKVINDRFGHVAGDNVLRAVGDLLSRTHAPGDVIGRLGGDEFGCLMTRYDAESVRRDSARLIKEIADLDFAGVLAQESCPSLSASAGLTFARPMVDADSLMSEAWQAAYEAKRGRNQLVVFGELAEAAKALRRDLQLQHFENSTRVATERLVEMITLKSRRLVEAAKQEAYVCSQTGLHNRRYFDVEFPGDVDRGRRQGHPLSLALIDLDNFHDINMTYGWPTGDRVLRAFASVARANVRATDWVARYGGEEIVIVMPDTALDCARHVAERVRAAFEMAVTEGVAGQSVKATLSAGVAQWRDDMESPIAFVNHASDALLRAKRAGRNRVE